MDHRRRLSMQTKMAVMTMRAQGCHSNIRQLLRMKEQLKSCLEFGSDIPGIWFWVLGPASDDQATMQDVGSKPEANLLWQEITDLLRCAPQPVLGVAIGRVGIIAAMVLDSCDYVFADAQSDLLMRAWLDAPQKSHLELADVVFETTEALYKRCQKMARQIEKLNCEELLKIKKTFRCLRLRSRLEPASMVSGSARCGSAFALASKQGTQRVKLSTVPEECIMI